MTTATMLSEAERNALEFLIRNGGSVLTSSVPDKNEKDMFGNVEAGAKVYVRLEGRGFVIITEEDPIILEDGTEFTYTNEFYITDEGRAALSA